MRFLAISEANLRCKGQQCPRLEMRSEARVLRNDDGVGISGKLGKHLVPIAGSIRHHSEVSLFSLL